MLVFIDFVDLISVELMLKIVGWLVECYFVLFVLMYDVELVVMVDVELVYVDDVLCVVIVVVMLCEWCIVVVWF